MDIENIIQKLENKENLTKEEIAYLVNNYALWDKHFGIIPNKYLEAITTICEYAGIFILVEWCKSINDITNDEFSYQPIILKEAKHQFVTINTYSFYNNKNEMVFNIISTKDDILEDIITGLSV